MAVKIRPAKDQALRDILNKIGTPYFVMAASHLMDAGYRHMTEEVVNDTITEIKQQDDSNSFMTNDFQVFIVETAHKISKAGSPIDLAKFLSKITK